MPRIIGGSAGGRRLAVPRDGTRPTTDRVREAVAGLVEARIELAGARVLDLFAGSGALGIEALSRGAAEAVFVERDASAASVIEANLQIAGGRGRVRREDVARFLAGPPTPFDLVFLDPPYDVAGTAGAAAVAALGPWLAPGALVVAERGRRSPRYRWPDGVADVMSKTYGDTVVDIGRREEHSVPEQWTTPEEVAAARERFEAELGWERPVAWGLVRRTADGPVVLRASTAGWLSGAALASVLGHRTGTAVLPVTADELGEAIALLEPAEACPGMAHPNMATWRAAREDPAGLVAVFAAAGDRSDDPAVAALLAAAG